MYKTLKKCLHRINIFLLQAHAGIKASGTKVNTYADDQYLYAGISIRHMENTLYELPCSYDLLCSNYIAMYGTRTHLCAQSQMV